MGDNTYKLYYFSGNGRAAISRAILYHSKAKFEDVIVSFEEWPKMKTSGICDYQQLPILEYKGKFYSQSHAIEMYLGKTFNLYGKDLEEEYQINSLLDSYDDLFAVFHKIAFPDTDELKKNLENNKADFLQKFEFFISVYNKHYEKNGNSEYFLGNSFTIADIFLCVTLFYYAHMLKCEDLIKIKTPKLYGLIKKIKENELKEYFDKGYNYKTTF